MPDDYLKLILFYIAFQSANYISVYIFNIFFISYLQGCTENQFVFKEAQEERATRA